MGKLLLLILTILFFGVKTILSKNTLSYNKWGEILISFFIFTCCLGYGLPIWGSDNEFATGSLGLKYRIDIFTLLIPFFLFILIHRYQWKCPKISIKWLIAFIILFCFNIYNPHNTSVISTTIAFLYLGTYLLFLFIITSTIQVQTLVNGIYYGLLLTAIVHLFLIICYPILGIDAVVKLFRETATVRSILRPGGVGTFSHPNILGVYASYYYVFFLSCVLLQYRKKLSLYSCIISSITIIFTFSRSAILAMSLASVMMIALYTSRNQSIFSIKIILTKIVPILLICAGVIFLTPLKNSFVSSNMDEMMKARIIHYYAGYEIFIDAPFRGVGLNTHLQYLREFKDLEFFEDTVWMPEEFFFHNPIHNVFIILLTELGIFIFLAIIAFIAYRFYKLKQDIRSNYSNSYKILRLTTIGIFCCLLVQGMSEWAPISQIVLNLSILFIYTSSVPAYKEKII